MGLLTHRPLSVTEAGSDLHTGRYRTLFPPEPKKNLLGCAGTRTQISTSEGNFTVYRPHPLVSDTWTPDTWTAPVVRGQGAQPQQSYHLTPAVCCHYTTLPELILRREIFVHILKTRLQNWKIERGGDRLTSSRKLRHVFRLMLLVYASHIFKSPRLTSARPGCVSFAFRGKKSLHEAQYPFLLQGLAALSLEWLDACLQRPSAKIEINIYSWMRGFHKC